ncbi:hypothetical protein [Pseudomonas sp. TSRC2-2]|uniref:hypothetical protein n=1 Tax=unclassified Pseudomonas TaxID=196821 RepID=UPI003CF8DEF3
MSPEYAPLAVICTGFISGLAGYMYGFLRAQSKYIPQIIEANHEVAKLKLLARLDSEQK